MSLQGLRIVEEVEAQAETIDGDSDDEDEDTVPTAPDDEITETAINLLLSILEGTKFLVYLVSIRFYPETS